MRIGRYLLGRPPMIWKFDFQESTSQFDTFTDANWAGCRRTRKSTSGGVIMVGTHLIKSWAKTQATIARSSAEFELYGIVRGTCEVLGFISLAEDLGAEVFARLRMDATAAQGIIDRQGLSKVRHLDVNVLCQGPPIPTSKPPPARHAPRPRTKLRTFASHRAFF